MTVDIKELDGKTVVTVTGELDTLTSEAFQKELDPIMGKDTPRIEIDMAGVNYIASKGLRVILALAQSISPKGGKLTVVNLTPAVRMVFDMSGFSSMFVV
ncbi:MAG: STAS domain-containing protein [Bacteroidales bacterium]|nr:STAS domain-containing protein [Bacteroidales bacterium]